MEWAWVLLPANSSSQSNTQTRVLDRFGRSPTIASLQSLSLYLYNLYTSIHFLPPLSFTPRTRSSLPMIWLFGIAFPDSYSWIICGFSLICCNTDLATRKWDPPKNSIEELKKKSHRTHIMNLSRFNLTNRTNNVGSANHKIQDNYVYHRFLRTEGIDSFWSEGSGLVTCSRVQNIILHWWRGEEVTVPVQVEPV